MGKMKESKRDEIIKEIYEACIKINPTREACFKGVFQCYKSGLISFKKMCTTCFKCSW